MTAPELHVVVPGPLEQLTGGYIYDSRIVSGLRRLGWQIEVHNLEGSFPDGGGGASATLMKALATIPDGARVALDGLAMGALPRPLRAHRTRLRLLSIVHHPLADERGLSVEGQRRFADLEREALMSCLGAIVTSPRTATRLEAYGVPPERIRAVYPGTDASRIAEGPAEGVPPRMVCVASVIPRKGHDVLVAALALMSDLSWTCVCAGDLSRDTTYAAAVLKQVAEAGLTDRIDFLGECDLATLEALYHGSSLFVLASYYEGYGMALAEALARGVPIMSTTGGAIPFTVPSEASILVPPGDHRAMADALRTLLTVSADRDRLASAAVRCAGELPDWSQSTTAFARAVEELAG